MIFQGLIFAGPWPKGVSDHESVPLFQQFVSTIAKKMKNDSEITDSRKRAQKWTQLLLFVAQIVVSCSEKRASEAVGRPWACG